MRSKVIFRLTDKGRQNLEQETFNAMLKRNKESVANSSDMLFSSLALANWDANGYIERVIVPEFDPMVAYVELCLLRGIRA